MDRPLRITSLQSRVAEPFYRAMTAYLGARLGTGAELVFGDDWREGERALDAGEVDAAFVCGWNYTARVDAGHDDLELCAAPVASHQRYRDRPVYFSDVIVRADSDAELFDDLRGSRWAYNEPRSHSGYNLTLYHLRQLGESGDFFASATCAGGHARAVELVLAGSVDASSIDSYVLELLTRDRPELSTRLRVIDTLGPSPAPPLVVRRALPASTRDALRAAAAAMHSDPDNAAMLATGLVRRYQLVRDADYDPIRAMARAAAGLSL